MNMNENNKSKKIIIAVIAVLVCIGIIVAIIYYMNSSFEEKNAKTVEAEKIVAETVTDESSLSNEELVEAVRNYCYEQNPDLKDVEDDEEYPVYWDVSDENDTQVVVVFRSYTGALNRFYIDKATGDTYVTEYVPMVMEEEAQTGESFNINDYLAK